MCHEYIILNPFVPNAPFPYPLKPSENRKGGGQTKGASGTNGLNIYNKTLTNTFQFKVNTRFFVNYFSA